MKKQAMKLKKDAMAVIESGYASRRPLPYFFQRPEGKSAALDVTSLAVGEKKTSERSENGCDDTKLFASLKF